VDHALLVGRRDGLADPEKDLEKACANRPVVDLIGRTFAEQGAESAPADLFHGVETVAIGESAGLEDRGRARVVETGEDLPDELSWIKFSHPAWAPDGRGFYYSRYPAPDDPLQQVNDNNKVYFHALGTSQDDDVLIYERPDHPSWGFGVTVTEDGTTLVVGAWEGTAPKNRVFLKDLSAPDPSSIFNFFGALPWAAPDHNSFLATIFIGLLPILLGISMWLQQKLNPAPADPTQQMIFAWMPWIFMFMLGSFASGLVLYWIANNTITFVQQYTIMSMHGKRPDLFGNIKSGFKRDKSAPK